MADGSIFTAVDHIGVAVDDLDAAIELYERRLAMPVQHRETVEEQGVEAVLLGVGDSHVELLRPLADETAVGRFIAKRGPGLHHTAYRCPDVAEALEQCRQRGLRLIDESPRRGIRGSMVAFLHPSSTGGTLTELVQPAEDH
jgi:methylmalonyl-CoA/ethylmalonyl-CoA epimerase